MILLYHQNNQYSITNTTNTPNNILTTTKQTTKTDNSNNAIINIQTEKAKLYLTNNTATFLGNVIIKYDDCTLCADCIHLDKKKQLNNNHKTSIIITGTGHVKYCNNTINIYANNMWYNVNTQDINLYQGYYQIINNKTHGTAHSIKQRADKRYTTFKNITFTSCPPDKKYWQIIGSEILYDNKKKILNIWNAYFKLGKTPIFYIPYLHLPLTRTKNFNCYLPIPQYSNKNGIEIKIPYYVNYNKNYYAKLTTNYIHKQGTQLQNKIHYSNIIGHGSINFDVLNEELKYIKPHCYNNKNRWLIYWKHAGTINEKWYFTSNYIKISDPNYFYDIESKYSKDTNNCTKKKLSCNYINNQWKIDLSYITFQPINTNIHNIYNAKPQFNIHFHNTLQPFTYHIFSQITKFTNTNHNYPNTIRIHIEPSIYIECNNIWGSFNTEAKLQTTHYQQNNINQYNKIFNTNSYLKHSVTRLIPQLTCNATFDLQKEKKLLKKYQRTLKPHFQYLYIPYHNQNNIALYDTSIFQSHHINIFNDPMCTGLDRIISRHQLASNATTKIYDIKHCKLFKTSLGQIYYFKSPNSGNRIQKINKFKNHLIWTNSNYWYINHLWGINTNLQYDTQIKKTISNNAIIEYKKNMNKILQINYQYINNKHITNILPEPTNPIYQKNISQIGLISRWIIYNNHWILNNAHYFDIKNNKILNQITGIQYNTCCWTITIGYEKNINIWTKKNHPKKYNNKLSLNIILSGITNTYKETTTKHNILNNNTLPYNTIL